MSELASIINVSGFLLIGFLWIGGNFSAEKTERELRSEINTLQSERLELRAKVEGLTIGCLGSK
jgi:hypothetical protein